MIGEREVLVAELHRMARHRLDGVATVGPVGVQVQVAAQRGAYLGRVLGRRLRAGIQIVEVLGRLTGERLFDHGSGARADPRQVGQLPGVDEPLEVVTRQVTDGVGGAPERLRLLARVADALEQLGDALEGLDGFHPHHRTQVTVARASTYTHCFSEG